MLVIWARGVSAVPGAEAIMIPVLPGDRPLSEFDTCGDWTRERTMGSKKTSQRRPRRSGADDQQIRLDGLLVSHGWSAIQVVGMAGNWEGLRRLFKHNPPSGCALCRATQLGQGVLAGGDGVRPEAESALTDRLTGRGGVT